MKIEYGYIFEHSDGHLRATFFSEGNLPISNEEEVRKADLEEHAGLFRYEPGSGIAEFLTEEVVQVHFELAKQAPVTKTCDNRAVFVAETGSLYPAEYFEDEANRMHP